jgi:hypothetical protein
MTNLPPKVHLGYDQAIMKTDNAIVESLLKNFIGTDIYMYTFIYILGHSGLPEIHKNHYGWMTVPNRGTVLYEKVTDSSFFCVLSCADPTEKKACATVLEASTSLYTVKS